MMMGYRELFTELVTCAAVHGLKEIPSDEKCDEIGLLVGKLLNSWHEKYFVGGGPDRKRDGVVAMVELSLRLATGKTSIEQADM